MLSWLSRLASLELTKTMETPFSLAKMAVSLYDPAVTFLPVANDKQVLQLNTTSKPLGPAAVLSSFACRLRSS